MVYFAPNKHNIVHFRTKKSNFDTYLLISIFAPFFWEFSFFAAREGLFIKKIPVKLGFNHSLHNITTMKRLEIEKRI